MGRGLESGGAIQRCSGQRIERAVDEVDLPEPDTPVTQVSRP